MQEEFENKTEDIIKAKQGNNQAMEKLIEKNKGLIWNIVKRFQGRGHEMEDLYQVGVMGFIKCIKRFDSNFEVKLSTYAVPYILGEIKRYIRDNGPIKVSRSIKELSTKKFMEFSTGQQRRLALAKVFYRIDDGTSVMIVDEPVGNVEDDLIR